MTTTLTEDESPYTIYAKHTNSNTQNTCSTTFVSYTYDGTVPTISSASFAAGSIITLTMSENVYAATAPTASDFKVKSGDSGSETANVVTTITGLQTAKASADNSFTLTVTTALVSGNSVKVYYTKGTNAVTDTASNALATIAESSAITATEPDPEPTVSFDPPDGANLLNDSDDIEITFSDSVYADSSGTDFTDDTIDALFTLKQDHPDGSAVAFDATISGNTVTINPTNDPASGAKMVLSLSDGWYHGSGVTKLQGSAQTILVGHDISGSNAYDYVFSADAGLLADGLPTPSSNLHIATTGGWFSDDCSYGSGNGYSNTSTDTNYIGSIITLKQNNAAGTDISFTASISDNVYNESNGQNYITINPTSALSGTVYLAIAPHRTMSGDNSYTCYSSTDKINKSVTFAVDQTAPTVSSVNYYKDEAGTNTLTTVGGVDEVYSVVTFSDRMREVVSDTVGLPRIAYKIGSTGTEVEYDIVASTATLASGDCKETGTGSNDKKVYTCRLDTTNSTPTGDFKTYTKTYKDTAGNAGTAQTYASLTGKVTITNKTISISAVSTDDFINATEDDSAVTISGTSANLSTNTSITLTVDDDDADTTADVTKTGTTNSSGNWSVSLSTTDVTGLSEGFLSPCGNGNWCGGRRAICGV